MHDTYVTVIGNVVSEPSLKTTGGGLPVLNLRVASTPRHFDATSGEWRDRETTFLSVTCWRALAENVSRSVHRGDAVVVHGKLLQRSYETGHGERRTSTEVEAATVGHDLARGTAAFA
ncbi:MAG: single-stranded DNA-binding protein, partial [Actinomycetota bacterium]|nr:single-stranded DNA-binding protein [Actinomycetota bacterium]